MICESFEPTGAKLDVEDVSKPIVKILFSTMCPWSNMFLPIVDEVVGNDPMLEIIKYELPDSLNYSDSDIKLLNELGINYLPSVVAFDLKGQECDKIIGFAHEEELKSWINKIKVTCR